jgi:hypothetical protein
MTWVLIDQTTFLQGVRMANDIKNNTTQNQRSAEIAGQITQMLNGIKFGSIEIIIHDNKVVQIERKEKVRFDANK